MNAQAVVQQQRMVGAQAEAQLLEKKALDPNLPPDRRAAYRNLARSAAAEAKLRKKALDYLGSDPDQLEAAEDQMPPQPLPMTAPTPPPPSLLPTEDLSTKPETSG